MELARWRNGEEAARVTAEMLARGLVQTGAYGGIGPFGGEEVGVFEDADPAKRVPDKCRCNPFEPKWSKGCRVAGYLVCARCNGRIE